MEEGERRMLETKNLSETTKGVIEVAEVNARALKHHYIGTEHILLALSIHSTHACHVLRGLGVASDAVYDEIVRIAGRGKKAPSQGSRLPITNRVKQVLDGALREALSLGHSKIRPEHLLLGLAREGGGVAMRILGAFDVDAEKIINAVIHEISRRPQVGVEATEEEVSAPKLMPRGQRLENLEDRVLAALHEAMLEIESGRRPKVPLPAIREMQRCLREMRTSPGVGLVERPRKGAEGL